MTLKDIGIILLTCSDAAGNSKTAQADIKVDGPHKTINSEVFPVKPYIDSKTNQIVIGPKPSLIHKVVPGDLVITTAGMDASFDPAEKSNAFFWIQLLNRDVATVRHAGGRVQNASTAPNGTSPQDQALDGGDKPKTYIHERGVLSTDTPSSGTSPDSLQVNEDFEAQTYLMWDSGKPSSVPAVLGSTTWGYTKQATPNADKSWKVDYSTTNQGHYKAAASILDYPRWRCEALNGGPPPCKP